MGAGGVIIIAMLAESEHLSAIDRAELRLIQDRSMIRCSLGDAMKVLRIVWKYLRP